MCTTIFLGHQKRRGNVIKHIKAFSIINDNRLNKTGI